MELFHLSQQQICIFLKGMVTQYLKFVSLQKQLCKLTSTDR